MVIMNNPVEKKMVLFIYQYGDHVDVRVICPDKSLSKFDFMIILYSKSIR